jgi:hypothetical protein
MGFTKTIIDVTDKNAMLQIKPASSSFKQFVLKQIIIKRILSIAHVHV